jgi:hypothetical protein
MRFDLAMLAGSSLARSAQLATAFMLSKEKNVNGMKTLLDIIGVAIVSFRVSIVLLLITSVYMGITAG